MNILVTLLIKIREQLDTSVNIINPDAAVHIDIKTSNISRTLAGDKIVDNSYVVGASPVGAAPTTSSFST